MATENKINIAHEIDCSNREAIYFSLFKQALSFYPHEYKRYVKNCDCEKIETAKHCGEVDCNFSWVQKKVFDRENKLVPGKFEETIYYLKNLHHINNLCYVHPEIRPANLQ